MKAKPSKKTEPKLCKEKPQPKHLQTFSSSCEEKSKQFQASVTSLTIARPESKIVRKIVHKKKKKTHSISKSKIKQIDEEFEKIAYKDSHSQSFIVFSNDETEREQKDLCYGIKNVQHIQSITENTVNPNLVLRVNIKKEYIRKTEAATKIQKVMRGFMTRKVLNKCIEEEEEKLRNQFGNSSRENFDEVRQNETYRTFIDKDTEVLVNKLFGNKNNHDGNFNHTMESRTDFYEQSEHQNYFEEIGLTFPNKNARIFSERQNISNTEENNERMEEQSDYESEEEEDSEMDESSEMIYRRQNPIYSQSEISHYLESSEEEEEEVDQYEPDIIFETNEEYLESRKSSLQNKNEIINKLSNKGESDIALIGIGADSNIRKELRANNEDNCNEKGEDFDKHYISTLPDEDELLIKKKFLFEIEHKEFEEQGQVEGQGQDKKIEKEFETRKIEKNSENNENEEKQKHQIALELSCREKHREYKEGSPKRQSKYLDQEIFKSNSQSHSNTNKSKKSNEQKEILRLKEQEREKWEEVIQMVSHQIKKNQENSGEMSNFMQTIMDLSQKNKELLESTCSVNSESETFCTPTSYGMNVLSTIEAKSCPINEKEDQFGEQLEEERIENKDNNVKFLKKKPLKIDVPDENLFEIKKKTNLSEFPDARILSSNKMEIQKQKSFSKKSINHSERSEFSKEFRTIDEKEIEGLMIKKEFPQTDDSKKLKNFLSSNIQDSAVYDILKLREELLQNRESEELTKLNNLLSKKQLTQEDFLKELSGLTNKFLREKELIDKSKEDILKGYQAANDLVKEYFFDVRRMGIKLAVSRSQDNLNYKVSQSQNFMNNIQIDELSSKIKPKTKEGIKIGMKEIFGENEISQEKIKENCSHNFESSEESSIDFTEEELKRFRKAANYDLEFNDLNKNLAISEDFIKQQRKYVQEEFTNAKKVMESPQKIIQTIEPLIETYHLDDKLPCLRTPPHIEEIIESEVETLVCEFAAELMVRPSISDKFIDRNTFVKPLQISSEERNKFLKILEENLPEIASLNRKLNQNITPLPSEILKCMRLDFSEDNEDMENDENYEEVNKYEFVISQESCAKSVMLFKNVIDQIEEQNALEENKKNTENMESFDLILKGLPIVDKIQNFIRQRSEFMQNRRERTRELRWVVMNIELHCIFDSWNEEIVQICSTRAGFSGIGLNELTLSLINHNKLIPISQTLQITQQSKEKVIEILNDDMDINAKILEENYREMCKTDSAWIFYADEALSYALELVYLVEEQIYTEIVKELRKIMVKSSFLI